MDAVVDRRSAARRCASPARRSRTDETLEVRNPYSGALVGTVPAARPEHVRRAFAAAKGFRPALSRYQRQRILLRTAEALASRKDAIARLITAESGLCLKDSLYEVGRACDVFSLDRPARDQR